MGSVTDTEQAEKTVVSISINILKYISEELGKHDVYRALH